MTASADFREPGLKPRRRASTKLAIARGDHEFLPAALEILEAPPSPVRMAIILVICAFVVVALAWSWIGRLDIIATAQGKVHPSGRVKVIQPLDTAKVTAIRVRNGDEVRAGQVLIRLDPSDAQADVAADRAALEAYEAEADRRRAVLAAALSGRLTPLPAIVWKNAIAGSIQRREVRVLAADLNQLASSISSLRAQADQKRTEQTSLRATIAVQEQLVETENTLVGMDVELRKRGAGSKTQIAKATESLQIQQTSLAEEQGKLADSQAAQAVVERNIQETRRKFVSENAQKLDDAERRVDDLRQKLTKAHGKLDHMTLRSPIEGAVQALSVTTIGQVLTSGQEIMRIVPKNSNLAIEAYLPNADRGFVKQGDKAVVKVASFPFTRYGTLPAIVVRVAHDAISTTAAMRAEADPTRARRNSSSSGGQATQNLVYPVTLKLQRKTMNIDGAQVSLSPGMGVTVEIRTGSRRILQYLFSPLIKTASEAMQER